jgi:hypothetical protein
LGSGEAETTFQAEVEAELWGRARRSPPSEAELEAEPWGRARQSFLLRLRLILAIVSFTLAGGTAVGEGRADALAVGVTSVREGERERASLFVSPSSRMRALDLPFINARRRSKFTMGV